MRSLSSRQILWTWERGERWHPLDQALLLLAAAEPETPRQELAGLSVGRRDAGLLALRERTFGPRLRGFAACPGCAESLEFTLSTTDLRAKETEQKTWHALARDGYRVRFRLPNSHDLAAVSGSSEPTAARVLLLERCLVARKAGRPVPASALPTGVVEAVEARMSDLDPQGETILELRCAACGHQWRAALDIGSFFWQELAAEARRLLREVHLLASAYGWGEAEILALTPARRNAYLAQVMG